MSISVRITLGQGRVKSVDLLDLATGEVMRGSGKMQTDITWRHRTNMPPELTVVLRGWHLSFDGTTLIEVEHEPDPDDHPVVVQLRHEDVGPTDGRTQDG